MLMSNDVKRHLPKAPIIQAVLEIQVESVVGKSMKDLQNIHVEVKHEYPKQRKRIQGIFTLKEKEAENVSAETKQEGFSFTSENNLKTLIVTLDQFNYMQNTPYNTWEEFISEAKELWHQYRRNINPVKIRRISVRYINQINIKLPLLNIEDYFLTFPTISEKLPQTVEHFYMRYTFQYKEKKMRAHIVQTVGNSENNEIPFLFDIDVLTTEPMEENEELLWKKFNEIRDIKNEIFFSSLTEQTLKQLQ